MTAIDWQYEDLHFAARRQDNKVFMTSSAICNGLGMNVRHLSSLRANYAEGIDPLVKDLDTDKDKQQLWPLEYALSIAFGMHRLFGLGNAPDDYERLEERATLHMIQKAMHTPLTVGEWAVAIRRVGENISVLRTLQKVQQEVALDMFKVPHLRYPRR